MIVCNKLFEYVYGFAILNTNMGGQGVSNFGPRETYSKLWSKVHASYIKECEWYTVMNLEAIAQDGRKCWKLIKLGTA